MRLHLLTIAALAVMILAAGCSTRVRLPQGVQYPSQYNSEQAIVVAMPDELEEYEVKVKIGRLHEQHTFKIPVMKAYTSEAGARMMSIFGRNVTLTTHKTAQDLLSKPLEEPQPGEAIETGESEDSLDAILKGIEDGQETSDANAKKKDDNEVMEDRLRDAAKQTLLENDPVYILWFRDAALGFPESQAVVSFRVALVDRRTNAVLLDKRYRGRSQIFRPYRNNQTNEEHIVRLVKQAFSSPMQELVKDVADRTGAQKL